MQQGLPADVYSYAAIQTIFRLLWDQKVQNRVNKTPPLNLVPNHLNTVQNLRYPSKYYIPICVLVPRTRGPHFTFSCHNFIVIS